MVFAICPTFPQCFAMRVSSCFLIPTPRPSTAPPPLSSTIGPLQVPLPCTPAAPWATVSSEHRGQHLPVDTAAIPRDQHQTRASPAITPHAVHPSSACFTIICYLCLFLAKRRLLKIDIRFHSGNNIFFSFLNTPMVCLFYYQETHLLGNTHRNCKTFAVLNILQSWNAFKGNL